MIDPPAAGFADDSTTADLVHRARRRDEAAIAALYDRHFAGIVRLAVSILGDHHLAQDIAQEAWAVALADLEALRDPSAFRPWLHAIGRNAARRQLRRQRREALTSTIELHEVSPAADAGLDVQHERRRLGRALQAIPERDRRMLMMRHVEERSVSEIAAFEGLTGGSTRVVLTRARKRLAAAMERFPMLIPGLPSWWTRVGQPTTTAGAASVAGMIAILAVPVAGGHGDVGGSAGSGAADGGATPTVATAAAWHEPLGFAAGTAEADGTRAGLRRRGGRGASSRGAASAGADAEADLLPGGSVQLDPGEDGNTSLAGEVEGIIVTELTTTGSSTATPQETIESVDRAQRRARSRAERGRRQRVRVRAGNATVVAEVDTRSVELDLP